jgi:hypothetical protein
MSHRKKNAIFMMCIINQNYVLAACIAAYCHRKLLETAKIKDQTDIAIMCDHDIYDRYHDTLNHPLFFDVVQKIDLRTFEISEHYQYSKEKYSSWIGSSLNKWQIFKYEEYSKILFVDISLLPVDAKLYDIFELPTPSVYVHKRKNELNNSKDLKCKDGLIINHPKKSTLTYDEYLKNEDTYGLIQGALTLIKPSKKFYDEYVELTNDIYKNGIYSIYKAGPDETSLCYLFLYKDINMYSICHDNALIPWDEPILINIAKSYVFSSMYKPWTKPKVLSWPEEILWRDIYDIIIKKLYRRLASRPTPDVLIVRPEPMSVVVAVQLKELFKKIMVGTFRKYIDLDQKIQQKNFNTVYLQMHKNEFEKIEHLVKGSKETNIKKIRDDTKTVSDTSEREIDVETTEENIDDDEAHVNSKIFDALMKIDTKIYVKYYGRLKTASLVEVL